MVSFSNMNHICIYIYLYIHTKSLITGGQNILELLKRWMGLGNLMKHGWIARLYPLTISVRELLVRSQKRMDFFPSRNDYSNSSVHNRILIRSSDDGKAYRNPQNIVNIAGFLKFSWLFHMFYPFLLIGWQKRTDPGVHGMEFSKYSIFHVKKRKRHL